MISQEMNLKEQIHHHLFSDIVNGVYTPGSILHEKNLMEKYGVSRAPIREALIQLCSEGVLRNLPKRGYEVTEISAEEIQNIIRYRISLECGFMQQYGGYIDDALIDIYFHLLLFSNYRNDYAYKRLQESMATQTRFYAQKRSRQWHSPIFYDADGLHVAIVDYLKQKNYSMASNILKADIEDSTTM